MKSLWKRFSSLKTTTWLLCTLAVLLLLNVLVPQATVLGEDAFSKVVMGSELNHFFLVTLDLGRIPTSPVFLGVLGLFFANLLAVLADRGPATFRLCRAHPPSEEALRRTAGSKEALSGSIDPVRGPAAAEECLRGFGYRPIDAGEGLIWGVKHRFAPIGFLLFHLSFLLLCIGGVELYYTRFVGLVRLVEGQNFCGHYGRILRLPPLGGPPTLGFALENVTAKFKSGAPIYLAATLVGTGKDRGGVQIARVNHPAKWGDTSVLVESAGVAPVFWLQDHKGFTLDRVSAAANIYGKTSTRVPLNGALEVIIAPLKPGSGLPGEKELPTMDIPITVVRKGLTLFQGSLRLDEAADVGEDRLVLQNLRYWASFRVVAERGGGFLIIGFLLATSGLIWRMLAYRREVVLAWKGGDFKLAGRAEFFRLANQDEVQWIFESLQGNLGVKKSTPK